MGHAHWLTRARILGLNEPVVEIPLDDGVGIGMMVRNAFAQADNIHMRASMAGSPLTTAPATSPMRHQEVGDGEPLGSNDSNVRREGGEAVSSQSGHLAQSASDTDMQSTSSLGSPQSDESDAQTEERSEHEQSCAEGGTHGRLDNGDADDVESSDSLSEEDGDATDDTTSDCENLEDLLGQIPNTRMGSNPEMDVAATLPLYEGSTLSMLCATLLIVNCCKTHGVSNMFVNELLMLLSMSILPTGNCLPTSEYEATKILRRLGLSYKMIDACPNGCCLFRGDLEDREQCPVCEADRHKMCGRSRVPSLILRHFPLIPQLQRMFSSRKLSKLNVWHHFHKSVDGKMRHTADS